MACWRPTTARLRARRLTSPTTIWTPGTQVYPVNKLSIKGDHVFNEKQRISGYYGMIASNRRRPDGPPTLPGTLLQLQRSESRAQTYSASVGTGPSVHQDQSLLRRRQRLGQDHKPPQEYIGNWQSKFCLGNVPNCNENLVNLFSGGTGDTYSTWGGQADNGSENTVYAYNDDFTWIHGKHTFKFGGMYQLNHYNGFGRQCEAGCVGSAIRKRAFRGNQSQCGRQRFRVVPARLRR